MTKVQMVTGDGAPRLQLLSLFGRAQAEIRAMIQQAELRDDQETLAFLRGDGRPPLGIVGQPELNDATRESNDHQVDLD